MISTPEEVNFQITKDVVLRKNLIIWVPSLVLLLCSSAVVSASRYAPPPQELQPLGGLAHSGSLEYRNKLQQILFERAGWDYQFQFLSKPSFRAETLFSVRLEGEDYVAQVLRPIHQSIWSYNRKLSEMSVMMDEKVLPGSLAARARKVWIIMLLRSQYQRSTPTLDGVSYEFFARAEGYGGLVGQSRNPKSGTRPHQLAEIGELFVRYVKAPPEDHGHLEAELRRRLQTLETNLEESQSADRRLKIQLQ